MLYELSKELREYIRGSAIRLVGPDDVEQASQDGWEALAIVGGGDIAYMRGSSFMPVLRPATFCLMVKKKAGPPVVG